MRADLGISRRKLSEVAGIDPSFLRRVENGTAHASLETYTQIAAALGADPSFRLYPNTGPKIRDRHQAGILEAILAVRNARWQAFVEIAVRRPSRGWIDLGLHDPRASVFVAVEIQSDLRRIEQLIRWAGEKADSLPSWDKWTYLGSPDVSRLLVVRDTRTTRTVAAAARRQLQAAHPADPRDALEALKGAAAWPGGSILWALGHGTMADPWRLVARP